jgi:hypothetical protein
VEIDLLYEGVDFDITVMRAMCVKLTLRAQENIEGGEFFWDYLGWILLMVLKCHLISYSLHPKLLKCFDWNTNIKESMRNL